MNDLLGWLATGVFVSSYFTKHPATLRRIQGVAACLWAAYGVLIDALPVIGANLIVAGAAIWTSWGARTARRSPAPSPPPST